MVDKNMIEATELWCKHRIPAGSCTMLLLAGLFDEAFKHAHPMIKPYWEDHINYFKQIAKEHRLAASEYVLKTKHL